MGDATISSDLGAFDTGFLIEWGKSLSSATFADDMKSSMESYEYTLGFPAVFISL
jgi:hypothetical protein